MPDRPRFFDDIAGVAGGAFSAVSGLGDELQALIRARVDEVINRLALVRRDEFDALQELASRTRAGLEAAEARIVKLEARVDALESSQAAPAAD